MTLRNFSASIPLLLLTDYPADAKGGGAVILRSLLRGNEDRIVWCAMSGKPVCDTTYWNIHRLIPHSTRRGILFSGRYFDEVARNVLQIARETGAAALWAVTHGSMVAVAGRLSEISDLPMHVTVHDDPPFATNLRSRKAFFKTPAVERDFRKVLQRAKSVDVICQAMRRRYLNRYGVDSSVVHRGLLATDIRPTESYDRSQGIHVGIIGNTYSYRQLPVLAEAIIQAGRKAQVKGKITVCGDGFGPRLKKQFAGKLEVCVTGHIDEAAAIDLLRNSFLQYIAYPFSPFAAVLRQTSFPTKLSTYVMAARPLLFHAPADSSVNDLRLDIPYLWSWQDMNPETGAQAILNAWTDLSVFGSFAQEAESLRNRVYDLFSNREKLLTQLDALPS